MPASHTRYGDITAHKSSGDHDSRYAKASHNHDDRYYTEYEMNAKLKDIVVTKPFKSGNASVGAKGTKEMTVSISVPSGYKFLAVSNLATNNEVCPSYFSWRDGNTLHTFVINPWDSAKTLSVTAEVQFIKS